MAGVLLLASVGEVSSVTLSCRVVDAETGEPLACRLYITGEDGKSYFAESTAPEGTAIKYDIARSPTSVERHTSLSAHPFKAELPAGKYDLTIVRGKEYVEGVSQVRIGNSMEFPAIPLRRWSNVAADGWYSGDTHVHRTMEDLPTVMLAEDLNVAFPLTYWVTVGFQPPTHGNKNTPDTHGAKLLKVDDTHVIYPRNTEYEIFRVGQHNHTLGAVFILNHQDVFEIGVPPVKPVAKLARQQGALLELDKHNWPWSMALIPLMGVDLFELSNNHVWRTEFFFRNFGEPAPPYMKLQFDGKNGTEEDWLHFGFENYYTLLNCGFDMKPTAGTASGVHPVPLGFGRVYVHVDGAFSYDKWVKGLAAGKSFVTTGPMMRLKVNGAHPGKHWQRDAEFASLKLSGSITSMKELSLIEVIRNGEVVETITPANDPTAEGGYVTEIDQPLSHDGSAWFAVRCFEKRPGGKQRFAHSGVWHVDVAGKPLRPRKEEAEYLVQRVASQIERSRGILPEEAIAEYEEALNIYQDIAAKAR